MINQEAIMKGITPKNDIVFRKIFGSKGSEGILKGFLESVLDIKIEKIKLDLATELLPDFYYGKGSRLDVRAELEDKTTVNIEVQTNMREYSDERSLTYWSKLYTNSLNKGEEYSKAQKTICIWILDGAVYDFGKCHSKWIITEEELRKNYIF